jgi:hypothetical protein
VPIKMFLLTDLIHRWGKSRNVSFRGPGYCGDQVAGRCNELHVSRSVIPYSTRPSLIFKNSLLKRNTLHHTCRSSSSCQDRLQ